MIVKASHFCVGQVVILLAALACGWGVATARADLKWQEETVEVTPEARAAVVHVKFPFTNTGTTPVDIQEIKPSCGCTAVELAKRHYAPGEGGELAVDYTVGDHVGTQRKSIMVMASGQEEATVLTIVAHVPEWVQLAETSVTWKSGETATAKAITLTVPPGVPPLDELTVQASNPSVSATLRPAAGGREYELQVKPVTTDKPAFAALVVRARLGKEEKTFRAYATVERGAARPRAAAPAEPSAPAATVPDAPSS